eukprot:276936-Pleurochrysis_carterae.AAC.4
MSLCMKIASSSRIRVNCRCSAHVSALGLRARHRSPARNPAKARQVAVQSPAMFPSTRRPLGPLLLFLSAQCGAALVPSSYSQVLSQKMASFRPVPPSPFALAQTFPTHALLERNKNDGQAVSLHLELSVPRDFELSAAAVAADLTSTAQEFASAAADFGVMLSHAHEHGTVRYVAWGSKRALQRFVRRCTSADFFSDASQPAAVTVTWQQRR